MVKQTFNLVKFLCVLLLIGACTKKEPVFSKEEMFAKAPKEGFDKLDIVLARNINDSIPCSDYGDGCLSVHRLKTRDLDFIAVEFTDSKSAKTASWKVHGWTAQNWLFDDIEGEPLLIEWLKKYYQGERFSPLEKAEGAVKKPSESVQP